MNKNGKIKNEKRIWKKKEISRRSKKVNEKIAIFCQTSAHLLNRTLNTRCSETFKKIFYIYRKPIYDYIRLITILSKLALKTHKTIVSWLFQAFALKDGNWFFEKALLLGFQCFFYLGITKTSTMTPPYADSQHMLTISKLGNVSIFLF